MRAVQTCLASHATLRLRSREVNMAEEPLLVLLPCLMFVLQIVSVNTLDNGLALTPPSMLNMKRTEYFFVSRDIESLYRCCLSSLCSGLDGLGAL